MTRLLSRLRSRALEPSNGNGHRTGPRLLGPPIRRDARASYVVTAAESAPCTCPDFCERDHGNE
jgi:hypothetical protein